MATNITFSYVFSPINRNPRCKKTVALKTVQNMRQVPRQLVPGKNIIFISQPIRSFNFSDVRETAERYLTALKPLVPDFQFAKSEKSVEDFIKSHASKFNSLLNGKNTNDSSIMTHA